MVRSLLVRLVGGAVFLFAVDVQAASVLVSASESIPVSSRGQAASATNQSELGDAFGEGLVSVDGTVSLLARAAHDAPPPAAVRVVASYESSQQVGSFSQGGQTVLELLLDLSGSVETAGLCLSGPPCPVAEASLAVDLAMSFPFGGQQIEARATYDRSFDPQTRFDFVQELLVATLVVPRGAELSVSLSAELSASAGGGGFAVANFEDGLSLAYRTLDETKLTPLFGSATLTQLGGFPGSSASTDVPLPPGLPLALWGVACLAAVSRRRRPQTSSSAEGRMGKKTPPELSPNHEC